MQIIAVFVFAFFIRLIGLNQSLWLDEAVVAKVVHTIPFHLIPSQFSPADFHPPLYYLFISLWSQLFGTTEVALRMPSVLFSLIAGWYVFKTGRYIKNKTVGFWSAVFFLFNPLIIYYSQEARMYMMATMFLSIALYYFTQLTKTVHSQKVQVKSLIVFNIVSGLALITFYGSIFFIGAMIIVFMLSQVRSRSLRMQEVLALCVGPALMALLITPLLMQQTQSAKMSLSLVSNWSLVLGKAELKNFFMLFIKFTSGRLSWFPKWSYYLPAGVWMLTAMTLTLMGSMRYKKMGMLFLLPIVLGLTVSFFAPMMQYFRFLYCIPPMSILIALYVSDKKRAAYVVWGVFMVFSLVYLLNPLFYREDWQNLSRSLRSDVPTYMISASSDPLRYYAPTVASYELRSLPTAHLPEVIQVVPYVEDIYGFNHAAALTKRGCIMRSQRSFRGPLFLEVWVCLKNA